MALSIHPVDLLHNVAPLRGPNVFSPRPIPLCMHATLWMDANPCHPNLLDVTLFLPLYILEEKQWFPPMFLFVPDFCASMVVTFPPSYSTYLILLLPFITPHFH
jgi:hypothetical protein